MSDDNKPYTTKPTTQLDLEARREADYQVQGVQEGKQGSPYAVEGNDTTAYLGVDADRRTYASDTEKPLKGEGLEDSVNDEDLEVSYDDPDGNTDPKNEEGSTATGGAVDPEPVAPPKASRGSGKSSE